jgi:hypothetical protein
MAEEACARSFVTGFGLRAYRRPLIAEETDRLMALYQKARTTHALPHAGGIRMVIEALLQAPAFLYHAEGVDEAPIREGKVFRFGHYAMASRLSYFLWGTMPDAQLFDAAARKQLGTPAEIEAQARRMIGDRKARDTVAAFVDEWLNLDQVTERPKDPAVYPEWKDEAGKIALTTAMNGETRAFVENVVFDGDGRLGSLLTGRRSFVNQPLAPIYDMNGVQGMELKPSMLDPARRSGLLTRAAFLTVTGATNGSHPVKRGRKVYERLLCGELPPPPPTVPPPKPASAGGTTRQRFDEHGREECASVCHSIMDPIGFAFEHYDGIGRWRDMDNGGRVDATGAIALDGARKDFTDAVSLSELLASSTSVRDCMVRQWARFALRRVETEADAGSLETALTAFVKEGSIRDLLLGVAMSRSFRYRSPNPGEM